MITVQLLDQTYVSSTRETTFYYLIEEKVNPFDKIFPMKNSFFFFFITGVIACVSTWKWTAEIDLIVHIDNGREREKETSSSACITLVLSLRHPTVPR
jgi:hypothetical protein